jgi:hypothetical protein
LAPIPSFIVAWLRELIHSNGIFTHSPLIRSLFQVISTIWINLTRKGTRNESVAKILRKGAVMEGALSGGDVSHYRGLEFT